jgi:GntR family transcriptional regulator
VGASAGFALGALTPPPRSKELLYTDSSTVNLRLLRINPTSGVPLYLQLVEQIKHSINICALMPGDQLPGIRTLAQDLVLSPTTIVKAYSELEHEGVIEIRHGSGAFVVDLERKPTQTRRLQQAQADVNQLVRKLHRSGLGEAEIRRLFEAEFAAIAQEQNERRG